MEESEKISGKKKLPSIPSTYVTLVQLQERWIKEREQKEKEQNPEPELKEQGKKQVEERVNEQADGRGSRRKGHSRRYDREGGKRVEEGKPKGEEATAALAVNQREGVVEQEKGGEKLNEEKKKKWKYKRKNRKKEKAGGGGMREREPWELLRTRRCLRVWSVIVGRGRR